MNKINVYSDFDSFSIVNQLLPNHKVINKQISELKKHNKLKEGGIIFLGSDKVQIESFNLTKDFLIITNKDIGNISNKNLLISKAPMSLNKLKNLIKKFLLNKKYVFEDIEISDKKLLGTNKKTECFLTDIENEILLYLINTDQGSKEYIKKNILNISMGIETNSLDSHLTRIRKKLEKVNSKIILQSKNDNLFFFINHRN